MENRSQKTECTPANLLSYARTRRCSFLSSLNTIANETGRIAIERLAARTKPARQRNFIVKDGCAWAPPPWPDSRAFLNLSHPRYFILTAFCHLRTLQEEMSSLSLFHTADGNIDGCFGTILARSWYNADGPPFHAGLDVQFEWLSLILLDQNRVRAAALYAAYYQFRSKIKDDQSAIQALEQQHYRLQCSITPINSLPTEIIMEIFHIALDTEPRNGLMLVCRHWFKIIEGMSDIWNTIDLRARTVSEFVERSLIRAGAQPLTVDINIVGDGSMIEGGYSALSMAVEYSPQWETLIITSLPQSEQEVQSVGDILSNHLQPMNQLKHFKVMDSASSPLLSEFLRNLTEAAAAVKSLVSMDIRSSHAIQCLFQPTHASICCSLTTFIAKAPNMGHPVDLLPHFRQLKVLDLTNVFLPIYDNSSPLPLAHTLHHLHLKAVSVQWMGGQVFSQLESCRITAPPTGSSPHLGVHLMVCRRLHMENWNITPVGQFYAPALDNLGVRSNVWSPYRGNEQVVQLCKAGFGTGLRPRSLSLSVVCKDKVLLAVLQLLPGLERLVLDIPRPTALGRHFFIGLCAKPVNHLTGKLKLDRQMLRARSPRGWKCTVCPSLKILQLRYQRWLRPGCNIEFLPQLFYLGWSRSRTSTPLKLHVQLKSSPSSWESFELTSRAVMALSDLEVLDCTHFSLVTSYWESDVHESRLFTPFFYPLQVLDITIAWSSDRVLNVLPSFQQLKELSLSNIRVPPLAHDVELPLVNTLKRLSLSSSTLAWMDGRVFEQLERFDVDEDGWPETFKQKVAMPICTYIAIEQKARKVLPLFQSNFDFPFLDTFELIEKWSYWESDEKGVSALQSIQAKTFKIAVFADHQGMLEFLACKDEVEQLVLSYSPILSHAEDKFAWLSMVNAETGKLPCPNMKTLGLKFFSVLEAESQHISQWCIQMMHNRKLGGHPIEKCCIWWDEEDWEKAASLVLFMRDEEVRMEL